MSVNVAMDPWVSLDRLFAVKGFNDVEFRMRPAPEVGGYRISANGERGGQIAVVQRLVTRTELERHRIGPGAVVSHEIDRLREQLETLTTTHADE